MNKITGQFTMIENEWVKLRGKHETDGKSVNIGIEEIFLLSIIRNLSTIKNGVHCTASNAFFADVMCLNERTIQKYLKNLRDVGIIKQVEIREKGSFKTTSRTIHIQYDKITEFISNASKDTNDCSCAYEEPETKQTNDCAMDTNKHVEADEQIGQSTCTNVHPNNNNIITNNNNNIIYNNFSPSEEEDIKDTNITNSVLGEAELLDMYNNVLSSRWNITINSDQLDEFLEEIRTHIKQDTKFDAGNIDNLYLYLEEMYTTVFADDRMYGNWDVFKMHIKGCIYDENKDFKNYYYRVA